MRRRELAAMGGAAALVAAMGLSPQSDEIAASEAVWMNVPCPGCGLPVAFLPGQRVNRCAHCKTKVTHGLV